MNIQSQRLIIRPAIYDDFPHLRYFYNNEQNMQFIQSGKSDWSLNELLKKWDELNQGGHIGLRVVVEKETSAIIGECGLLKLPRKDDDFIEIGYMVDEYFWGKGFGSEIAQTLVDYARDIAELSELKAGVNALNVASVRILEKCGFTLFKEIEIAHGGKYLLYQVSL